MAHPAEIFKQATESGTVRWRRDRRAVGRPHGRRHAQKRLYNEGRIRVFLISGKVHTLTVGRQDTVQVRAAAVRRRRFAAGPSRAH